MSAIKNAFWDEIVVDKDCSYNDYSPDEQKIDEQKKLKYGDFSHHIYKETGDEVPF